MFSGSPTRVIPLVLQRQVEIPGEQQVFLIEQPGQGRYQTQTVPVPHSGEVLCQTLALGLCGSDHRAWQGTMPAVQYPRVPGHEAVARVVDDPIGKYTGMFVVINPYKNCGVCTACVHNKPNACRANQTLGVQRDGLARAYFTIDHERILGVPVDHEQDARRFYLVEPLAVAIHAVERLGNVAGCTCLVAGYGTIGKLLARHLRASGATVIVVDRARQEERLNGVTYLCNQELSNVDLLAELATLVGRQGVDVTLEAAGAGQMVDLCLRAVDFGGRVLLIGHSQDVIGLRGSDVVFKELNIIASRNATRLNFREAISLLRLNPQWYQIPEKHYPADQMVQAFEEPQTEKVVIDHV